MTLQLTKKHNFDVVYDSQKVFRLILDAMSNPTKLVDMEEYADKFTGSQKAFLAIAITLLDNETSFCVCGDDALADEITSLTLAKKEELTEADFIFVIAPEYLSEAIENAKSGTLSDPHKSATIVILNEGDPCDRIWLHGPGIKGQTSIWATETVKEALALRKTQYYEYPQGIDLIFMSGTGKLFAIPRLTS